MTTPSSTQPLTLHITGMDCADCARTIEKGVGRLQGVTACAVNLSTAQLTVEGETPAVRIEERVRQLGYGVVDEAQLGQQTKDSPGGLRGFVQFLTESRDTTLALIGLVLVLPPFLFNEMLPMLGLSHPALDVLAVGAMLVAGYPVARSAWNALILSREININVLMTIAGIGAVIIGAYTEAGMVMVLFALGEAMEGYSMEKARRSLTALLAVTPDQAIVLRPCMDCGGHLGQTLADGSVYDGGPCPLCGVEEQVVGVAELTLGETALVKPGNLIPVDGRVLSGFSAVNQAPITGESVPVDKEPGAAVYAGSVNGPAALEVEVTALAADSTLSRMVRLVQTAQANRAPVERFVDQFARVYTPLVMALAALTAVLPPLIWGAPFWNVGDTQGWLYRGLTLLVIACPCALVISTPVALISAVTNAARHGVLVKGGRFLEAMSRVRAIAFDKTGTLTAGQPAVVTVRSVACMEPDVAQCEPCGDLLALAAAVEQRSEHPLARAVVAAGSESSDRYAYPTAQEVTAMVGAGVSGQVAGRQIFIGSHPYFDQHIPHTTAHCAAMQRAANQGQTPMLVSVDEQYLGYITVADRVRADSAQALADLKGAGIERLVMLTGDNGATAQAIADQLGVTDVRADLLPEQKVAAIQELLAQHGPTAMVGDGINDAPALATATVGIAVGAASGGTAQAMETADIALMGEGLTQLPFLVRLSRAAMNNIRQNVVFSIGIKLVFLILVLLGAGSMWMAVLADVGASVLVTLNGMRLSRFGGKS